MANHNENLKSLLESIFINNNLGDANYTEICNQLTVLINNIIKVTQEHINHADTALNQHNVQNNKETSTQLDVSCETQDMLVNDLHVPELEYNSVRQEIPNNLMDSVNIENDNNQLDDLLESQESYHANVLGEPENHNEADMQENIEPDLEQNIYIVSNEEYNYECLSQTNTKAIECDALPKSEPEYDALPEIVIECDVVPDVEPVTECYDVPDVKPVTE
jgi:hypothetical protein